LFIRCRTEDCLFWTSHHAGNTPQCTDCTIANWSSPFCFQISYSYSEVKQFETNAAAFQGTDIPGCTDGSFVQYVADNVDHNVTTLHGFNTFPGMGIIATMTLGTFEDIQTCTTDVY